MKSRTIVTRTWAAALVLCAAAVLAQVPGLGEIRGGRIPMQVGESKVFKDVESYDIANPKIVTAKPTAEGDLILNAASGGTTTVLIRKKNQSGVYSYEVEVSGMDAEATVNTVRAALGGIVGLGIVKQGDVISLEGKVLSRDDGKRIDMQKKRFGAAILDLTERVYMNEDLDNLRKQLKESNCSGVEAAVDMGQDAQRVLVLRGSVFSTEQKATVMGLAGKFFDTERIIDSIMVNRPQIEVDVEVYAFDLTKARQLGTNNLLSQISSLSSSGFTFNTGPGSTTGYPTLTVGAFTTELKAVHDVGAVTNVMKQHASVRSGEMAHIENVTDQKIKIEGAFDAKLETVKVGQVLEIVPTVLETGRFETKVKVSVSDLVGEAQTRKDVALAVNNTSYEGTFISGKDEVVVLGGGKRQTTKEVINKTPILGSIPIISMFFKSKSTETIENTNVFFMTLRQPTTQAAIGTSFGSGGQTEKQAVEDKSAEKKEFIDKKVKQK